MNNFTERSIDIPPHIIAMAREVELYFKERNIDNWKLCGTQSRSGYWKPIDIAPRDWSDVIGYLPDGDTVCVVYYSCEDGGSDHWMDHYGNPVDPTYWMPLPKPPGVDL